MSFPILLSLLFFLRFLLPSLSLPVSPPSILGSQARAFVHGSFIAGPSATVVIADTTPLTPGAQAASPSSVLFLPQDASADGLTEPVTGFTDGASVSLEPDPAIVDLGNTQDLPVPGSTATSLTPLMMAYYPTWAANDFPPERIDFSRFDWIDFAFAVPNDNYSLDWDGSDMAPNILTRLVALAHQHGKKVKLSVGGWGGSKRFSSSLKNDIGRRAFVDNIAIVYNQYHLDGIDIDWEYPGQQGAPRNEVDPNDVANFLEFLKLLRNTLPSAARISAAVQSTPFADANGRPMADVRAFAEILDWALIMNYDVWGASPNPGPNAPLNNACQNSTQPAASADGAINAWTAAGFPLSKLVLGVPSYGYLSHSIAKHLRQRDENAPPLGVHVVTDDGAEGGQVQFRQLVQQGVLCRNPTSPGAYLACLGFTREWDTCSSTPFLYSQGVDQVITYDDEQSLELKSAYARQRGLLGVNIFDLHGDTDQWVLVDSLRRGLGL